ncbi:MAG: TetR/AcrR family transcriptional regulator [Sinimarinibacterium sp.]|jgi:AcrR family transcriptional regulator
MIIQAAPPDTRMRIVLAAMELFWEKGFLSASVADLLKRADVNAGSLYHFFPGKQDVLLAVLDLYHRGIWEMLLNPVWQGIDDPIERVFALLAKYREHILQTDCTYGCPIGSLALELHEPDPPVRELLAANFSAWTEAIEQCLRAAGPRLPRNTDRAALARFVLTTMEGGVMLARTYRDPKPFDDAVAQLRDHFRRLQQQAQPAVRKKRGSK